MNHLGQLADGFCHAFYEKKWPGSDAPGVSGLSLAEAYRVQDLVTERRINRGESIAGYKVGCTSDAIREQFGLREPISGRLFFPHTTTSIEALDWTHYANCAIEPEMVLRIAKDLSGEDLSDEELVAGIESVSPGIELHNFTFWRQPPTTQELICSGGIHAGLIIGAAKTPARALHFQSERFTVFKDGAEVAAAPASEIMGGPLHSLRWLVSTLTRQGARLEAGSYVIPGSPVELVVVGADATIKVVIEKVGELEVLFKHQGKNSERTGS